MRGRSGGRGGFTLIELMVVLAIIALLLTIAVPRYVDHVDRTRETTLKASLRTMREALDKFESDQGRLPASLQELVDRRYLREVPIDPMTDSRDTWMLLARGQAAPADDAVHEGEAAPAGGVADVRSGAAGQGRDGTSYANW